MQLVKHDSSGLVAVYCYNRRWNIIIPDYEIRGLGETITITINVARN